MKMKNKKAIEDEKSSSKGSLLTKFLEMEEDLVSSEDLPSAKSHKTQEKAHVSELLKLSSNKEYEKLNMAEEIVLWKRGYSHELHKGEAGNRKELRLERLVRWINPNAHFLLEFENFQSRKSYEQIEKRIFSLSKNELFGFLSIGKLDTFISVGDDIFISRLIEKDIALTRGRFLLELEFLKDENHKYEDIEYYEKSSRVKGREILTFGVRVTREADQPKMNGKVKIKVKVERKDNTLVGKTQRVMSDDWTI